MVRRRGVELLESRGNRVDHAGRNAVAAILLHEGFSYWIGVAVRVIGDGLRRWIVNRARFSAEVAAHDSRGWNCLCGIVGRPMIDDLVIIEEEEHLVLLDRTTDGHAEIVVVERSEVWR